MEATTIILEGYQEEAANWLSRRKRGLVKAPAGAGKTLIAAAALEKAMLRRKTRDRPIRVGWVANTREQVQQAWEALRKFPYVLDCSDMEIECAAAGIDWSHCDVLVVDEAHHASAPMWEKQIATCPGARWGISATPPDSKQKVVELETVIGLFGEFHVVRRAEVTSRLVPVQVMLVNEHDENQGIRVDGEYKSLRHRWGRFWKRSKGELHAAALWHAIQSMGIARDWNRTQAVINIACSHVHLGNRPIVLCGTVKHGTQIADQIPLSQMCHSKMGAQDRRDALQRFRDGELRCLVATSLADEGLDLPMADVCVLVSGGKSRTKAEQRTGRVARTFSGKEKALVYDFVDSDHPQMAKHSAARCALYADLDYEIGFLKDHTSLLPGASIRKNVDRE